MRSTPFLNNVSRGTQKLGKRSPSPWLFPILLLLIWQAASSSGLLQSRVLPAPTAVVSAFWHLLISGELWHHVKVSAGRALAWFIGRWRLSGLVLGLLNGSSSIAFDLT